MLMYLASQNIKASQNLAGYTVHLNVEGFFRPPLPRPQPPQHQPRLPGSLPGQHVIAEFHGAASLDDVDLIRNALSQAAERADATLLALHHHLFTPDAGVTAFA